MLHKALKAIRNFHQVKQADLAERLEVSKSYLSLIESGKKEPPLRLIHKYSDEFNIPVSSIMFFSEHFDESNFVKKARMAVSKKVIAMMEFLADD